MEKPSTSFLPFLIGTQQLNISTQALLDSFSAITKTLIPALTQTPSITVLTQSILSNIQHQQEVREMDMDEFNELYAERIEQAKVLGAFGCVISPHMTSMSINEIDEILKKEPTEEGLLSVFFDCNNSDAGFSQHLFPNFQSDNNLKVYSEHFLDRFNNNDFFAAAMLISAIFDRRVKDLFKNCRRYSGICNTAIPNAINECHIKLKADEKYFYSKFFLIVDYLPSVCSFIKRFFIDGDEYNLDTGKEPAFLNRNWLMHGKITREVKRYEILQIINALQTVEEIIKALHELES